MAGSKDQRSNNEDDRSKPNEDIGVMVFGNLKIIDVDTGEVLINKRA
jgi:hypothetical protein